VQIRSLRKNLAGRERKSASSWEANETPVKGGWTRVAPGEHEERRIPMITRTRRRRRVEKEGGERSKEVKEAREREREKEEEFPFAAEYMCAHISANSFFAYEPPSPCRHGTPPCQFIPSSHHATNSIAINIEWSHCVAPRGVENFAARRSPFIKNPPPTRLDPPPQRGIAPASLWLSARTFNRLPCERRFCLRLVRGELTWRSQLDVRKYLMDFINCVCVVQNPRAALLAKGKSLGAPPRSRF